MSEEKEFNVFIVETDEKRDYLLSVSPSLVVYSLEKFYSISIDYCNAISFETIADLKELVSKASNVYISPYNTSTSSYRYKSLISYLDIDIFLEMDFDVINENNIIASIKGAVLKSSNDVKLIKAEYEIFKLFRCEVTKVLQWYFNKEGLASNSEIASVALSYPVLVALDKIMLVEERIMAFTPEELHRVSITYLYKSQQFKVKHKDRFPEREFASLDIILNRISKPEAIHTVSSIDMEDKELKPPKLLNRRSLENIGVSKFRMSISKTIELANELRKGDTIIYKGKPIGSLITTINTTSTRVSKEVQVLVCDYIEKHYGADYIKEDCDYNILEEEYSKEAIRPIYLNEEYSPESLRDILTEEQYVLYSMIFYRTIANFMINAIVDTSVIVVSVNDDKLKAISSKIKTDDNNLPYDGWTKIGHPIGSDEFDNLRDDVEIPKDLIDGYRFNMERGEVLEINTFVTKEKNPSRYGEYRLKTLLEKSNLITDSSQSNIIEELKEYGLARASSSVLHPTPLALKIYKVLYGYATWIFDEEVLKNYSEQLLEFRESGTTFKSSIVDTFKVYVEQFKDVIEYKETKVINAPEEWLVKKAESIAKAKHQTLTDMVKSNRMLLLSYIKEQDETIERLGKCPQCKKGYIYETEKAFFCESSVVCNFAVWKNSIKRFLGIFKKVLNDDEVREVIKIILKNEKCKLDGFYSEKKQKNFPALVTLKQNKVFKSWELTFYDKNQKKDNNADSNN